MQRTVRRTSRLAAWAALGFAMSAAAYATYAAATWLRYGRPRRPTLDESDHLLDRFMPVYDVVDRHHIRVEAPSALTLGVARNMELSNVPLVHAIFKGREFLLGSRPDHGRRPKGLLDEVLSLGWSILAEIPGREIVVGSVTRPWEPNVTFRSIPSTDFASFAEPNYVKIVWTLRADPIGDRASVFRTETRAMATDAAARMKFRRYWSLVSPGIRLIRRVMLRPLKRAAERLGHDGAEYFNGCEIFPTAREPHSQKQAQSETLHPASAVQCGPDAEGAAQHPCLKPRSSLSMTKP